MTRLAFSFIFFFSIYIFFLLTVIRCIFSSSNHLPFFFYCNGYYLVYIYIYMHRPIGLECSLMTRETEVQSLVESYQILKKWYLIPPCLTFSIKRYVSRVMWNNPGKGAAPYPTPWCCSHCKRSCRATLDYRCQLIYIYMYLSVGLEGNTLTKLNGLLAFSPVVKSITFYLQ